MSKEVVKILSIDGGGVKGLIPAIILQTLSNELDNIPMHKCFDLISGTSTGALISLLLTIPIKKTSKQLVNHNDIVSTSLPKTSNLETIELMKLLIDLYENESKEIFKNKLPFINMFHQIYSPKYTNNYFTKLITEYFGDSKLSDAKTNLIIPALELSTMDSYFFKHRPNYYKHNKDLDFYVKDIALSASAAPTYFPPLNVTPINQKNSYCFVDGALFANNPSLCAYIEAKKLFPNAKKFIILSLGTGDIIRSYDYDKVKKWGVFGWVNPFNQVPLLTSFIYAQERSTHHMIKNLSDVDIYRLNPNITGYGIELDTTTNKGINLMKNITYQYIESNEHTIKSLKRQLLHDYTTKKK